MIDNIRKAWWLMGGGVVNNSYVQAVINKSIADGRTVPKSATITALNNFFNAIDSVMSKAEMIKIGALFDVNGLQFSRYNFVNPLTYESTFVVANPVYGLMGWSSDGSSYINDNIKAKRRANLQLDSSSIAWMDGISTIDAAADDMAACGCVSGNYYIIKPYYSGAGNYYYAGLSSNALIGAGATSGFIGVTTSGVSGTRPRWLQNTTYENGAANLTVEMTSDLDIYTCCYNNAGTPLRFLTNANIGFRWEGYELTDGEMELIRDSFQAYLTELTTVFAPSDTLLANGRELFLAIGHSYIGTSTAVGPRCNPNSVLQWNRTAVAVREVLAADLANVPSTGSMWPRFGQSYHLATQKKPVICIYGVGGAAFLNSFVSASYDDGTHGLGWTGTAYASAKTIFDAAVSGVGVTKPKGIFLMLGINDATRTETLSILQAQITSLITRLRTDYGTDTPIYVSIPTKPVAGTVVTAGRLNAIQLKLYEMATTYSNVYLMANEGTIFGNVLQSSNHFNYDGNYLYGDWAAAFVQSTESDKDIRRIQNSTFRTELNAARKAAYSTFITSQKAAGNWDSFAALQIRVASDPSNAWTDLTGLSGVFNTGTTIDVNDGANYDGVNDFINTGFDQTNASRDTTVNDIIIGVKTKDADTVLNTPATLFGFVSGTTYLKLEQNNASGLDWWVNAVNANKTTYTGDTKIQTNTHYALKRTAASGAGSSELLKDGSSVQSASVASTAIGSHPVYEGGFNNAGTSAGFWDGKTKYFFAAKASTFNYAAFLTDIDILLSALL